MPKLPCQKQREFTEAITGSWIPFYKNPLTVICMKSGKLVELCKERLGWKPTTTYTVIKKLSERGVLKNENTIVSSLVSKDQVQAAELNEMVDKTFEGSLPAFIAAFTKHRSLSDADIDAVQEMIDRYREGGSL